MFDRRLFLLGSGAAWVSRASPVAARPVRRLGFEAIERTLGPGGRLGVAALNSGTGQRLIYRADDRFPFCSTFKILLAAAWLMQADRGIRSLTEEIAYDQSNLTEYSPVTRANVVRGRLTVEQLCAAIVQVSDNAAANLLMRPIGGPPGLTSFFRRWGDRVSRLDRYEEALGTNIPGDARDTTSPAAMLNMMNRFLVGDALSPNSRARLVKWMESATTGLDRLRAGVPSGWKVGDKTGNGRNGAANDVAIIQPPGRRPMLIASYMSGGTADRAVRDAGHAAVARLVTRQLG